MSQTATETKTYRGVFRYMEPDETIPAEERSMFSQPRPKNLHQETLTLHNVREDTTLAPGLAGLDRQGFALIKDEMDPAVYESEEAIRKSYIPLVEAFVEEITGCRKAIVNNVAMRRKKSPYDGKHIRRSK
jgi:hypothetical protein